MVKRKLTGKHKSLLDFMNVGRDTGATLTPPTTDTSKSTEHAAVSEQRSVVSKFDEAVAKFDEVLRNLVELKKTIQSSEVGAQATSPAAELLGEKSLSEKRELQVNIPKGSVLDELLYKGLSEKEVVCDASGRCSDGISVGEIYVDKYGFKRQRGYVNTTRLPVFIDWIVEEAYVRELFPKTYVVETSRGSLAIVPEDFLCELHARYGVVLVNYDKCKNYKPVIGSTVKKRREKRS